MVSLVYSNRCFAQDRTVLCIEGKPPIESQVSFAQPFARDNVEDLLKLPVITIRTIHSNR